MQIFVFITFIIQGTIGFVPAITYYKPVNKITMKENKHSFKLLNLSEKEKNIDRQIELFKDYVKHKSKLNTKNEQNAKNKKVINKYESYANYLSRKRAMYRLKFSKNYYNRAEEQDN